MALHYDLIVGLYKSGDLIFQNSLKNGGGSLEFSHEKEGVDKIGGGCSKRGGITNTF